MTDWTSAQGTNPGGLRERKKRQTKQRIADEAASLFRLRGYETVRISDIAAAAEVSEQTLYNYFPSKETCSLTWIASMRRGLSPSSHGDGMACR
jgi:AcrR family transcriptional regulator